MQSSKKIITLLAITLFGVATFVPSVEAAKSNANVEFKAPTTPPAILNPDNPEETLEPEEAEVRGDNPTGEYGILTLDAVSDFNFGEQELSAKNETYSLTNKSTPFAQVTDVRGTGEGWRLVASLDSFTDEDTKASLPGATIRLNNTTHDKQKENGSEAPTSVSDEIVLSSDNASKTITTAAKDKNQGLGTWITKWVDSADKEGVVLDVPAAVATKGTHTAEITWTLYNAPDGTDSVDLES